MIVGEDDLTCALGERIVSSLLPSWSAAAPTVNTRGVTKLVKAFPRYSQFARNGAHVLCIADSDGKCPANLILEWLPNGRPSRLLLRVAVSEGESWALGDRQGVAGFFQVPLSSVPAAPDQLPDAKRELLRIAKRSRVRQFRDEMLSPAMADRQGAGYNVHLKRFVKTTWNPLAAEQQSPSLRRAMDRVRELS